MAEEPQPGDGAQGATFTIDKIYVKDLSLECPGSPQSFTNQEQPQIEVGLRTRGEQLQPDIYECVLTVTLTAKVGEKKPKKEGEPFSSPSKTSPSFCPREMFFAYQVRD